MADCILFVLGFGKLLTVPYVIESIERNLESLAADRKLVTSEHHPATDFYGHAAVFKRFAGKRMDRSLRVSIEHGVRFDLSYWAGDYSAGQTVSFVPSRWRKDVLHGQVDKVIRAVGPYIHYTPGLYPAEDVARVCQKMGKTLVVFPAHSTHWIDSDYDVGAFCRRLQMERDRFETILVCLYWKDVLRGIHRPYQEAGFPCVTAGHMFDPDFLPRLRSILEVADATLSNSLGTHLGYSLYLGKPHQLLRMEITRKFDREERAKESTARTRLDVDRFHELFDVAPEKITEAQWALANKYWGFESVRSRLEIRLWMEQAEVLALGRYVRNGLRYRGRLLVDSLRFKPRADSREKPHDGGRGDGPDTGASTSSGTALL